MLLTSIPKYNDDWRGGGGRSFDKFQFDICGEIPFLTSSLPFRFSPFLFTPPLFLFFLPLDIFI